MLEALEAKDPFQVAALGAGLGCITIACCFLLYVLCVKSGEPKAVDINDGDAGDLERQEILADVYGHGAAGGSDAEDEPGPAKAEDEGNLDSAWEAIKRAASSSDEGDLLDDDRLEAELPATPSFAEAAKTEAAKKQAPPDAMADLLGSPRPPTTPQKQKTQATGKKTSSIEPFGL
mmetsp:Transcript_38084/g.89194  ORF Transcript_38084/g.89194 Transcript_38084/m.89194 type:complete len:176 (-) Transcript_38084:158-685(-)